MWKSGRGEPGIEAEKQGQKNVLNLLIIKMAQGAEEMGDSHLQGGFIEFARVEIGEEIEAGSWSAWMSSRHS